MMRELMPMEGLKEFSWWLEENQSDLETNGNNGQVLEFGAPKWSARATFGSVNADVFRKLDAFIHRRKKALVTFTAFRPIMRAPLLNPSQSNSGLGLGTVDIENATIALTGLSANVSAGDMISYRTLANGYWIGQATADVARTGGNATVPVHPPPMAKHATTPAVRLFEALGEFKLVGTPQNTEQHLKRGTYSFTCVQHVE